MNDFKDKNGREYAKYSDLSIGDKVETDDGFTCMKKGSIKEIKFDGFFILIAKVVNIFLMVSTWKTITI